MNQQSEQINELAAALSKAQGEMQAAVKDKINPFFKSSYADLGSVWDAARPVLCKYGLCVMQTTEMSADGSKILMITTLAHTSGQWIKSALPLNPSKNDSQGIGAAITYLRRYSLSAIVGVVCDDDDDGETAVGRGKTNTQNPQPKATQTVAQSHIDKKIGQKEVMTLQSLIEELDQENKNAFLDWVKRNYQSIQEIPEAQFQTCLTSLSAKVKYINSNKMAVA